MKIRINKELLSLIIIKFFYSIFALYVYSSFTSLGDTPRYWTGPQFGHPGLIYNSTAFMDNLTRIFYLVGGPIFANLPFIILSSIGIFYPLKKANFNQNYRLIIYFLALTPSLGIWTSIASKEAMGVFFMGLLLGSLFDYLSKNRIEDKKLFFLGIYLAAIFKPQYLVPIFTVFSFIFFTRKLRLGNGGIISLFIAYFLCGALTLFFLRDVINEISLILPMHFSIEGGSTRANPWIEDYDFFRTMPIGLIVAFWGPTFTEALSNSKFMISFIETSILSLFIIIPMINFISRILMNKKLFIMPIIIVIMSFVLLLFVHYPFGYINSGSAIRYRSNFLPFLIILIIYFEFKLNNIYFPSIKHD